MELLISSYWIGIDIAYLLEIFSVLSIFGVTVQVHTLLDFTLRSLEEVGAVLGGAEGCLDYSVM